MLSQLREPIFFFKIISLTHFGFYLFPCFLADSSAIRNLLKQVKILSSFLKLRLDVSDSFFDRQTSIGTSRRIVWVLFDVIDIVCVPMLTDIIKYDMVLWMILDIYPFVKAVEHEQHAVQAFDRGVSDSLGGVGHDA